MSSPLRHRLLTLSAAIGLAIAAPAFARDFRSADVHPTDYPTVEAVRAMGKSLKEQSHDKLGVKVFASGALGAERDTIEQLKIGGLDMMRINAAPLNNIVPETIAISMPFVFRSIEHMRKVLDGPIGDEILAAMAEQGMVGLAFYDSGARSHKATKSSGLNQSVDIFCAKRNGAGPPACPASSSMASQRR